MKNAFCYGSATSQNHKAERLGPVYDNRQRRHDKNVQSDRRSEHHNLSFRFMHLMLPHGIDA